ncbi:MAG: hypothetical protein WC916_01345 [Candidatus Woesearchaeota archaeon]
MHSKLEKVIKEYERISNEDFQPKSKNSFFQEIEAVLHGAKFVLTRYYTDPKIKEIKNKHTEAVHEDLVNEEHVPYNLAVKIAKGTPMPVYSKGGKGIICTLWGFAGPGRTYYELFKHYAKYSGLKEKWLFRGSIIAELGLNDWSGAWLTGTMSYPLDKLMNYAGKAIATHITGEPTHHEIPFTELAITANIVLSYGETIKDWFIYETKGIYRQSKMLLTRAPGNLLFQLPAFKYKKYLEKYNGKKGAEPKKK